MSRRLARTAAGLVTHVGLVTRAGLVAHAGLATVAGLTPVVGLAALALPTAVEAQEPREGEVRQLVTFRFAPGRSADAVSVFRESALPLYRQDEAMLSFRGFREVESSVPLDLVVVSSFQGMAGMDDSNQALAALTGDAGRGIGDFYREIGPLIAEHHDQFVEMLPALSSGDPSTSARVVLIWYRLVPGEAGRFERTLRDRILPWERNEGIQASTGRFLLSDGWDYLRIVGFDSLGAYQEYWREAGPSGHDYLDGIITKRREVIVAPVPGLSVR